MDHRDLEALKEKFRPIIGLAPWDVALGVGSFVTLEFGEKSSENTFGAHSSGDFDQWLLYVPGRVFAMQANGAWTEESRR